MEEGHEKEQRKRKLRVTHLCSNKSDTRGRDSVLRQQVYLVMCSNEQRLSLVNI